MDSKPDIYRYHDYREFLKDWFRYLKENHKGFSLRNLSKKAGISAGYLPMVLAGSRHLSLKALSRLMPELDLKRAERSYLENLVTLGSTDSLSVRTEALEKMKRYRAYQKSNPREIEVYQYLTHWYYVAIREMAVTPGFKADPEWIQQQLRVPVALKEIKDALEFLLKNGYIRISPEGTAVPPDKDVDCMGGVYRVALGQFHREMFTLAAQSIENTSSEQRTILGHTFAIRPEDFEKAREILNESLDKIRALGHTSQAPDSVYHMEIALFPLTKKA